MTSEEFIDLGCDTINEATELDTASQTLEPIEVHRDEGSPDSDNLETVELHGREHDQQLLQSVVHNDAFIHQSSVLQDSVELAKSVTAVEIAGIVEPGNMENGCTDFSAVDNHVMEQSNIAGVKRFRMTSDERPSVHVVYKSLTRESRKKLEELLQQWSEWHAQNEPSSDASLKEALEHGEETYFPAFYVGLEKSAIVSFRVDKRARKEESDYIDKDLVPLYDRGYALGSTSADGLAGSERVEPLEASRCFNCGSYSHSLKDCPKPRDNVAISLARKQHGSKRNSFSGSRNQTRYYQSSSGKYDDLKAGVLGPELRKCLGIGELDPPPWLHRMRELGYPPGYLDVEEDVDQPSGITIHADEETKVEYEEGELPEKCDPVPLEKKMSVEFPGINAPIPENADRRHWAASPPGFPSGSDSFKSRSQPRAMHSEMHRGNFPDQKRSWDYRENGPQSSEYGPCHSPGYSPYDHSSVPTSPNLRRSLSDRVRGFPSHEGSQGHFLQSSSPYSSGHSHSTADRYSRSVTTDHRAFESHYSPSADDSLRRDRSSHRHH